jgi:hypothetical protein
VSKLNRDWIVGPHGPVEHIDDGLATVAGEIVMPLGRFPRRMTVVALKGGRSAIWSAIPLKETAMQEVEALGRLTFLIVPGVAHRLDVAAWKARYPAIKVLCPPGAYDAVKEAVPIDATSDPFSDPGVDFEVVPGAEEKEAALVVRRGSATTLMLNDILANVRHPKGLGAQIMVRLFGFGVHRPQTPRVVRRMIVKDKSALAGAFRRWAELPGLARVVVSHGDVIGQSPREVLSRAARELAD